jgi:hypothetical protein
VFRYGRYMILFSNSVDAIDSAITERDLMPVRVSISVSVSVNIRVSKRVGIRIT